MENITIRMGGIADAELVADISRKTFYDSFAAVNTEENMTKFMNDQFSRGRLMMETQDPANYFFIAESGGQVLGYMKMRESEHSPEMPRKDAIELVRIYAVRDAIGKGVGKALMEKAIEFAGELKKRTLWLGVWEHNKPAQSFYTKWGFEKFGEHPFMVGDDRQTDWLMKKELV